MDTKKFIEVSTSFQTSKGRHFLKTQDVYYCAFTTPNISLSTKYSQRDAQTRLNNFSVEQLSLEGCSVFDIGSHYGAMLFQLTNYGIKSGFGIEFDKNKVDLANFICKEYGFSEIQFQQTDIDNYPFEEGINQYDITLALSIEKHIKNRARLFRLIGACTKRICLFEGNAGCDINKTIDNLKEVGFKKVNYVGFCQDDILPQNNKRPNLIAFR